MDELPIDDSLEELLLKELFGFSPEFRIESEDFIVVPTKFTMKDDQQLFIRKEEALPPQETETPEKVIERKYKEYLESVGRSTNVLENERGSDAYVERSPCLAEIKTTNILMNTESHASRTNTRVQKEFHGFQMMENERRTANLAPQTPLFM